jgi:hypothetical protein
MKLACLEQTDMSRLMPVKFPTMVVETRNFQCNESSIEEATPVDYPYRTFADLTAGKPALTSPSYCGAGDLMNRLERPPECAQLVKYTTGYFETKPCTFSKRNM